VTTSAVFLRRRIVAGVIAVVLVVATGLGIYALVRSDDGDGDGDTASIEATSRTSRPPRASTTTTTTTTTVPPTTVAPETTAAAAAAAAPAPPSGQPAAAPPPVPQPLTGGLAGKTIHVDAGHNGQNWAHPDEINRPIDIGTQQRACDTTGTATDGGYSESEYTLDVALRLSSILQGAGANVVMTRTDNGGWGPCIDERAAIGNRAGAHAAISIHADGGPPGGRGFHVIAPASVPGLTDDIAGESGRLAGAVREAYGAGTGMPVADYIGGGGLSVRSDLGGLNLSDVPKVFIESGNMRNATDASLLTDPGFRQRVAESLAAGLDRFLGG
jgi:N-acetylmuramoyl-L-alanine amidase